ncbi:unnamed protein product, partial [Dicrocoelium dendriticum]
MLRTQDVWSTQFEDCGSVVGNLRNVSVFPCAEDPCVVYKGEIVRLTINFTAERAIADGEAGLYWKFLMFDVPVPLPNSDLCDSTAPSCPLQSDGTVYTYTYSIDVPESVPS